MFSQNVIGETAAIPLTWLPICEKVAHRFVLVIIAQRVENRSVFVCNIEQSKKVS